MPEHTSVRDALDAILVRMARDEEARAGLLDAVAPAYRQSARNFLHYLSARQGDMRRLQLDLWRSGLSSLGRMEGHAWDSVAQVRARVADSEWRHTGDAGPPPPEPTSPVPSWDDAERLLHRHSRELFGPRPPDRHVSIMVTAPAAREVDEAWAEGVLAAGMSLLRINAAHEDEGAWARIADTVRRVAARRGQSVRVSVDLPGPKLRTVALAQGPRVLRWRPERDDLGRTSAPCVVHLHPRSAAPPDAERTLAVPDELCGRLRTGDRLVLRDARDKRRELVVAARDGQVVLAELDASAYLVPDTPVVVWSATQRLGEFRVLDVPPLPYRLPLELGQRFFLLRPGHTAPAGLAAIGCTLDAALTGLKVGQRVLFDDGHLETLVDEVDPSGAVLRVVYAAGARFRLGAEKGINLPDTELDLPALTDDDERALAFAVAHADLIGASFVRGPDDVRELYRRLAALGAPQLGVMLKIETQPAFERLPAILLAAMERAPVGLMIARGDLAIEAGYERLAELQEEILWLAEAAHLPVVWATQVLDNLARTGRPSRAEVTDAAMSVRAECVMLNKGPYVAHAVQALADILRRMEQHQYKKRALYRRLHLALPAPGGAAG